jgi:hypothetical protein
VEGERGRQGEQLARKRYEECAHTRHKKWKMSPPAGESVNKKKMQKEMKEDTKNGQHTWGYPSQSKHASFLSAKSSYS